MKKERDEVHARLGIIVVFLVDTVSGTTVKDSVR